MAFTNLTERFEKKAKELYAPSANKMSDGATRDEPYIERKPDNHHPDLQHVSRLVPSNSIEIDLKRMTSFSKSNRGLLWYLDQQNLQSGNTFSETRIINPLFVLGNVADPGLHIKRPLANATGEVLEGNIENVSPGVSNEMGASGRLQRNTKEKINSLVVSGKPSSFYSTLVKLIPANRTIQTISDILNVVNTGGILGVDQRPEFDVYNDGTYDTLYSVEVWKGLSKPDPFNPQDNIVKLGNALRHGNISAAGDQIKKAAEGLKKTVSGIKGDLNSLLKGKKPALGNRAQDANADRRGDPTDHSMNGKRYFISGKDEVSGYLLTPFANNGKLTISPSSIDTFVSNIQSVVGALGGKLNTTESILGRNGFSEDSLRKASSFLPIEKSLEHNLKTQSGQTATNENAISQDQLRYEQMSLQWQYENDPELRIQQIKDALEMQKINWEESYTNITDRNAGFGGGVEPGRSVTINPTEKYKFPSVPLDTLGRRKYFFDKMNTSVGAIIDGDSKPNLSNSIINEQRSLAGTLVDFYFYDSINSKAIPFRSYLENISEQTTPKWFDTPFIGRTERFIVYSGAQRLVQFSFKTYAANEDELVTLWKRYNYLTSLCFPSKYDENGFMVPPLVKLTLGDIYNNQPGYISSLTYTIDEGTSWEIDPGSQVPMGFTINVVFNIVEKGIMRATATPDDPLFYNFGLPRSTGDTDSTQETNEEPSPTTDTIVGAGRNTTTETLSARKTQQLANFQQSFGKFV